MVDANTRNLQFVSIGFKLLAVFFLVAGIIKALIIGLLRLNPASLLLLFGDAIGQVSLDLGLIHSMDPGTNGVYRASTQEIIALILLAIGSGLVVGFVCFGIAALVDFIREVGVEILDLRRIQFDRANPHQR